MSESIGSNGSRSPTPLLKTRLSLLQPLLQTPDRIRNVCILAHVDHGKTTLTDSLLASNGIISFKQAGQLRYLDSREDEQQRGITMESSAISLVYDDRRSNNTEQTTRYMVNLIDSPGHVDFAGHVVTASRLCDGAVVLVDAVEGVCAQTMSVLRQAHREHLKLCLVINKIDRLILELKMDPQEAFVCIFKLLEQVNALQGTIDKEYCNYFDPERKGNVVFASATDGWAFTLSQFISIYSIKLTINARNVKLWGSGTYFDAKTRSFREAEDGQLPPGKKSSFAQLVFSNIWAVYNMESTGDRDNILKSLKITLSERELKLKDLKAVSRLIMLSWLPLSQALFQVMIDCLPDPTSLTRTDNLGDSIGHVAKMFSVVKPADVLRREFDRLSLSTDIIEGSGDLGTSQKVHQEKEMLIGMARLFSRTLQHGQKVYILGPKYDPKKREKGTFHEYIVDRLYLLMGRDLEAVEAVYAGNVFGICGGGIEDYIVKTGTISSTLDAQPLDKSLVQSIPLLLKVAVSPLKLSDLSALQHGLHTLCQADPCAETFVQDNGEQVLAVAGELHLEMCLKDLKERFTDNLEFTVSSPLVPFRETFTYSCVNRLDSLWREMLCDVVLLDEESGLLRVNFGYISLTLRALSGDNSTECLVKTKLNCSLSLGNLHIRKALESSLSTGFKLAVDSGPLCSEPVSNVSIVVTEFGQDPSKEDGEVCGRLISDFVSACHAAMLYWSPRLQLAYYSCDIQTTAEYLGKVYGVLGKRKGKVVSEEYNEATGFFTIHSRLPVIESFGFGHDLRSKTSGIAVPQLVFSGFDTLDIDPFALDADTDSSNDLEPSNDAMKYLMGIRERKGMFVERRIVECAEKQRTLRK